MKQLNDNASYYSKTQKRTIDVPISYPEYELDVDVEITSNIEGVTPEKILRDFNRMVKLDVQNPAREKVKTANGDSTRKALTSEQKLANKVKRQADDDLLRRVKEAIANGSLTL